MARGPKKHMKRMFAPHHWFLDKCNGVYATRPSTGPHKMRECLPLTTLLRQRLKYALNGLESLKICRDKDNNIKIDNRVRRDHRFPLGLMDVVTLDKTGEHFRMLYDVKGRFQAIPIEDKDAGWKLLRVKKRVLGKNKIPYIVTHDGRTIRYPHPDISEKDTIKYNLETGEIMEHVKFESGNVAMITGGNNIGRVGVMAHFEKHEGGFSICHLRDARGHSFATRMSNVMVIGKGKKPWVDLPRDKGIRVSVIEEHEAKQAKA